MINQFESLLKNRKKPSGLPNSRQIQGIQLKQLAIDDSYHSSVVASQRNSSMNNVVSSNYFNTSNSMSRDSSLHSFSSSRILPNISSHSQKKQTKNIINSQISQNMNTIKTISTQKQSPVKMKKQVQTRQITMEDIFKRYIDTNFIQCLMSFINKQWAEQQANLLKDKRFEALKNVIIQKTNLINNLIEDFMTLEYQNYPQIQRKVIISLLLKLNNQVLKQYEHLFIEILKKIPEDKIIKQQTQIQQLYAKLLEIYDPKYIGSSQKMKERSQFYMEGYTVQKNNLIAGVVTKLKPYVNFINEVERYLFAYQKQLFRSRKDLQALKLQKDKIDVLLKKKINFTPIQIDFEKFKQIKDQSKKQFFQDLQDNYINFHQQQHKKNDRVIKNQNNQNNTLKAQLQIQKQKVKKLAQQLQMIKNSVPKKQEAATQVHLLNQKKTIEGESVTSTALVNFLQNVSTPFSFSQKITASLINLLSIDKVLHDYEVIKHKSQLQPFSEFMMSWFLVRTGSKKIAQIFTKNFMYSVKQLKNKHKRFNIFSKLCGFVGFRKKNVQEDLQYIFFQTQRCWYYLVKIAIMYRKKLNDNPTGYHLFPPLQCQQIFKLPLRKVYELITQFLTQEGIEVPLDLNNQIDYYSINQISKFKSHDQQFQKQQLQQIHILRQINFDIIAGFVIEYMAKEKCSVLEKLLRAITMKQKESSSVLGYSQFEAIYRKFYRERRSKIQNIYSRMCIVNQHDMMDIQNAQPIIRAIVQDQSGARSMFQQLQSLKVLILPQKSNLRGEKVVPNINSYQNFRDRYYYQFYDFFNTTFFLQEIFRVIKTLVKKKLRSFIKSEQQLQKLMQQKQVIKVNDEQGKQTKQKKPQSQDSQDDEDEYSNEQRQKEEQEKNIENSDKNKKKNQLQSKVQEWSKIIVRIPHFGQKILTIDQIIVHNMRRKEMIEASEFAWRTLRDILVMVSKQ